MLFSTSSALLTSTDTSVSVELFDEDMIQSQTDVIDPGLRVKLSMTDSSEEIGIIVQFDSRLSGDNEKELLISNGFKPLYSTTIVPAIFATGLAKDVLSLSSLIEIKWVEWNAPLHYNMNVTKNTIKAQEVWDRQALDIYGDSVGTSITGRGITVVVLDSGIDATHPDLDWDPQAPTSPSTPSVTDKVIYNAKLDQGTGSSTPTFAWLPMQNTDTSSGHGTHCAGTVAGNGDASAGDKVGIAPDAWLIGLSMGEAAFTIDEYSGLEHVYELSKPGSSTQSAWNIRVVSNSWGPGFPFDSYDPNDLTVQIIEKLSNDNNVVVVFANGNDGGDGSSDQSNIFAKVPAAIGVAAANRNGIGMSSFSSRGDAENRDTWPDISAPGVDIWSAAARATLIGGATGVGDLAGDELDYYYLAISGTSMATPHVAGLVALLFQAAPSLTMSDVDEDLDSIGNPILHDPTGIANPQEASRYIHEAELILKLTSDYKTDGENIPTNFSIGLDDRPLDYAQGYGLVNADRAVALATALQELRDTNGDLVVDNPEVTVWDAYPLLDSMFLNGTEIKKADGLQMTWNGDFAVLASDNNFPPASAHRKQFFVPAGTTNFVADMDYNPLPTSILCPSSSNLRLALDRDGDGIYEEADVNGEEFVYDGGTEKDEWWAVDVQGNAIGTCLSPNPSTVGPRSPYSVTIDISLLPREYNLNVDEARGYVPYGGGSADINIDRLWYVHVNAEESIESVTGIQGMINWLQDNWWLPVLISMSIIIALIATNDRSRALIQEWRESRYDLEEDVFEADIIDEENDEIFEAELL